MRDSQFARLLSAAISSIANIEGKTTASVETELGLQIGVSPSSIQRYKVGHIPPVLQTIEILAQSAVERGYLNQTWLQRFLYSAHYPNPQELQERLRVLQLSFEAESNSRKKMLQNLPAPNYARFIGRSEEITVVLEGLRQRVPIVSIIGMGGVGKTSIAREVASQILNSNVKDLKFNAIVWMNNTEHPSSVTLSRVLDEIAYTLEYPDLTRLNDVEKQREVEKLLQREKTLLIIDNAETILDEKLIHWLIYIPEPSKVLVTARFSMSSLRDHSWIVAIPTLRKEEARFLLRETSKRLGIESLISDQQQVDEIVQTTGGNPHAIEIVLGAIKYNRLSLNQLLENINTAPEEIFGSIFNRAWQHMSQQAQSLLLTISKLPDGVDNTTLLKSSHLDISTFEEAIEQLIDMALVDVYQTNLNSPVRYITHSLVRLYVKSQRRKLQKQIKPNTD